MFAKVTILKTLLTAELHSKKPETLNSIVAVNMGYANRSLFPCPCGSSLVQVAESVLGLMGFSANRALGCTMLGLDSCLGTLCT